MAWSGIQNVLYSPCMRDMISTAGD